MTRLVFVAFAAFVTLAALAACSSPQKRTESLLETSTRFQEGLRWRRFEDAASHVPPAERESFLDEHDELDKDLRIDDYEVIRVHFKDGHEEAQVQVKYSWHLDGEGVVKETVTDQTWKLHGSAWWLEEEAKKRGEDMPGITLSHEKPDKPTKPHPSATEPDDAPAPPSSGAPAPDQVPAPEPEPGLVPGAGGNGSGGAAL
jgi:hypothetical protein